MTKFRLFLASISGVKSPIKNYPTYKITDTFPECAAYQELLESFVGVDGIYTNTILDNDLLTPGMKSLLFKIAAFATTADCYAMLDHIFHAVATKTPGFYFDLIFAIKKVNDICNNVGIKTTKDRIEYTVEPCNKVIFGRLGDYDNNVSKNKSVQVALRSLMATHIKNIKSMAEKSLGYQESEFLSEQLEAVDTLDNLPNNYRWRLRFIEMADSELRLCPNAWTEYQTHKTMKEFMIREQVISHTQTCGSADRRFEQHIRQVANMIEEHLVEEVNTKQQKDDYQRFQIETRSRRSSAPSASPVW